MQSKRRVSTVEQRAKFREKKPRKGIARGGGHGMTQDVQVALTTVQDSRLIY